MVDIHPIITNSEVFDFYRKQKTEFHFQQKTDDDFVMFLLDTAVRVISIVQHLAPVIEAVSAASTDNIDEDASFTSIEGGSPTNNMSVDLEESDEVPLPPPPVVKVTNPNLTQPHQPHQTSNSSLHPLTSSHPSTQQTSQSATTEQTPIKAPQSPTQILIKPPQASQDMSRPLTHQQPVTNVKGIGQASGLSQSLGLSMLFKDTNQPIQNNTSDLTSLPTTETNISFPMVISNNISMITTTPRVESMITTPRIESMITSIDSQQQQQTFQQPSEGECKPENIAEVIEIKEEAEETASLAPSLQQIVSSLTNEQNSTMPSGNIRNNQTFTSASNLSMSSGPNISLTSGLSLTSGGLPSSSGMFGLNKSDRVSLPGSFPGQDASLVNVLFPNRGDTLAGPSTSEGKVNFGNIKNSPQNPSAEVLCNFCNKAFTGRAKLSNLKQHISMVHFKSRPFQCRHCRKCFSTKNNMKTHSVRKHGRL